MGQGLLEGSSGEACSVFLWGCKAKVVAVPSSSKKMKSCIPISGGLPQRLRFSTHRSGTSCCPSAFLMGYSARVRPAGSIAFWDGWKLMKSTGGLCTKSNTDLDVVLGSPWLSRQAGLGAPRLCILSRLQPSLLLSWPVSCDGATRVSGGCMF